jgi:hypothetical protein
MSSTPDSISYSDLQSHLDKAAERTAELKQQIAEERDGPFDGHSRQDLNKVARSCVNLAVSEIDDPMVHKVMVCMILDNMIKWHTKTGTTLIKDGNEEAGQAWLRDAGIFQAALFNIMSIELTDEDFIC